MNNSALRDCRACGNSVSRYSPFCRQCGHPQGYPVVVWLLIALLMLMIAFYIAIVVYCALNVHDLRVYKAMQPEGSTGAVSIEAERQAPQGP